MHIASFSLLAQEQNTVQAFANFTYNITELRKASRVALKKNKESKLSRVENDTVNHEEKESNLSKNNKDIEMEPVGKIKFSKAVSVLNHKDLVVCLQKILSFLSTNDTHLYLDIETPYKHVVLLGMVRNNECLKCSKFNADCMKVVKQIIDTLAVNKHVYKWTYEFVKLDKNESAHPKLLYKKIYFNSDTNKTTTKENITSIPLKSIMSNASSINLFNKCDPSCKCPKYTNMLTSFLAVWIKKTVMFIKYEVRLYMEYPQMSKPQAEFMYDMIQQPCGVNVCTNADYYKQFLPLWQAMWIFQRKYLFNMVYLEKSGPKTKYLVLQKIPWICGNDDFTVDSSLGELHNISNINYTLLKDNVPTVNRPVDSGQKLLEAMTRCFDNDESMSVDCSFEEMSTSDDMPSVSLKPEIVEVNQKQLKTGDKTNGYLLKESHNFTDDSTKSIKQFANAPGVVMATDLGQKQLEGMHKPVESNKAIRMMQLMGWKGGALGLNGQGITEPIIPTVNVVRGAGLGHIKQNFDTTKEMEPAPEINTKIPKGAQWRIKFFENILDLIQSDANSKMIKVGKIKKKFMKAVVTRLSSHTIYPFPAESRVLQEKIIEELKVKCLVLEYENCRKPSNNCIKINKIYKTNTSNESDNEKTTSVVNESISSGPMRQFTTYHHLPSEIPEEKLTKNTIDAIFIALGYNESNLNNHLQIIKNRIRFRSVILVTVLEFLKSSLPMKVYVFDETLNAEQRTFISDVVKMTADKKDAWSAYGHIDDLFENFCNISKFGLEVKFGRDYKMVLLRRLLKPQTSKEIEATRVKDDDTSISGCKSYISIANCERVDEAVMSCERNCDVAIVENTDFDVTQKGFACENFENQIKTDNDKMNIENECLINDNNSTVTVANVQSEIDSNIHEKLNVIIKNVDNGNDLSDGNASKGKSKNCVAMLENTEAKKVTDTALKLPNEKQNGFTFSRREMYCSLLDPSNEIKNGVGVLKNVTNLIRSEADCIIGVKCENMNKPRDENETQNNVGCTKRALNLINSGAKNVKQGIENVPELRVNGIDDHDDGGKKSLDSDKQIMTLEKGAADSCNENRQFNKSIKRGNDDASITKSANKKIKLELINCYKIYRSVQKNSKKYRYGND